MDPQVMAYYHTNEQSSNINLVYWSNWIN